jgi:oligopeptide/dipeptide ABC transporter ATP-binding protein
MATEGPISDVLLDVRSITVGITTASARLPLVAGVSFSLRRGSILVIAGESGSGKTLTARALTNLFPESTRFWTEGEVIFEGRVIVPEVGDELRELRRTAIRYVFQEPLQALNPLALVRDQLRLASPSGRVSDGDLSPLLSRVGISDPRATLGSYPHQLSAGEAQRVMIAMALLPAPRLIIADEPTASVDAPLKFQILELFSKFRSDHSLSIVLVTHDLLIAKEFGDEIVLLLGGRVVERSPMAAFFERPLHPYSRELVDAATHSLRDANLRPDRSYVAASAVIRGCAYASQCPVVQENCRHEDPGLENAGPGREVRCIFWK